MTDQNGMSMPLSITADEHLSDARLHLRRATLALKAAATADPSLLVKLGSRHAALVEELKLLERAAS